MKAGCLLTSVWFGRWSVNSGTLAQINYRLPVFSFHVVNSGNITPLIIKQRLPSKGSKPPSKPVKPLRQDCWSRTQQWLSRTDEHSTPVQETKKKKLTETTEGIIICFALRAPQQDLGRISRSARRPSLVTHKVLYPLNKTFSHDKTPIYFLFFPFSWNTGSVLMKEI